MSVERKLTPEERAAILHEQREMARLAVANVLVQPKSSKDVLTEEQRARTAEVKAMLDRGENPFALEELKKRNKDLIGSTKEAIRSHRDLPDYMVKELEEKWSLANNKPMPKVKAGIDLRKLLPLEDQERLAVVRDPNKLYCSYCGIETERVSASFGTGPLMKKTDLHLVNDQVVEEVKYWAKKIIACPDCVLNIPAGTLKFPETEG